MTAPVPLVNLASQYAPLKDEILQVIHRVCETQRFIGGPEVEGLEAELASFCQVGHAVGLSSGSDALLVALMALGVGPGDQVITSAYSFFATAGAIVRVGATPVFVDIEADGFNMDPEAARAVVGPRTRALLPVHLYGRCARMDPLLALDLPVVEDGAQAIGARDRAGRSMGSMGLCGCISFFPSKNLGAFGDAGALVCRDAAFAEHVRTLRNHGGQRRYYHDEVGGNFRLDALQAAVLRVKLRHLDRWTALRRERARGYRERFLAADLPEVDLPQDTPGHVWNQFVIRAPRRDELKESLLRQGVSCEIYYPVPLPYQRCFQDLGYRPGQFPVAEDAAARSLALPMFAELTDDQQDTVVEAVRGFYRG